jgi:hypothetical protein
MATYFKKRNQWREILPLPGLKRCFKWFGSEEEANAYREKYFKETPWLVELNNFVDGKPTRKAITITIEASPDVLINVVRKDVVE